MPKFLSLKEETFGLDINDLSLKIVKLKKKRHGFALISFGEAKIAPGIIDGGVVKDEVALAKIIRAACGAVKGRKLKTKYAIASLPEEKSFLQVIQMPKMSREELELAVPLEAENYIPMPIDEVYLDFQVIPSIKNKDYFNHLEVLLIATPKKIVDSYVSCFKKAGLVPLALETESVAIARALVKKETNSSVLILVNLEENNTDFIVYSGNSVRFTASIPILPLEDLALQIKKYLNFYRGHSSYEYLLKDGKTEKILLCGGGAELKGLADFMSKKLEIPVELGNPLVKGPISFTTAIGLALRDTNN